MRSLMKLAVDPPGLRAAALGLCARQMAASARVIGATLGVDEAIDALVADDRPTGLRGQVTCDPLGQPAGCEPAKYLTADR